MPTLLCRASSTNITHYKKLEAQWAESVSLTFHSALRKLNTEPPIGASHHVLVIWLSSYREEDIQKSTNQKQEWPVAAMFINGSELNEQFYRWPSKDASYQVSVHLAKRLQRRRFFRNQPRIVCGGHVCKRIGTKWTFFIEDLPRMFPTKFRFIWPSDFRGEDFLEINQSETRITCGGHVW